MLSLIGFLLDLCAYNVLQLWQNSILLNSLVYHASHLSSGSFLPIHPENVQKKSNGGLCRKVGHQQQHRRQDLNPQSPFQHIPSKKTQTDDEIWTGKHGALLLGDIVSRLVSIILTHKENIWVFFFLDGGKEKKILFFFWIGIHLWMNSPKWRQDRRSEEEEEEEQNER